MRPGDLVQLEHVSPRRGRPPAEWSRLPCARGLLVEVTPGLMPYEGSVTILDDFMCCPVVYEFGPVWQVRVLQGVE